MSVARRQRIARVSREAMWIALGQVGVAVGALVAVRVLTSRMSASAYGELALGMTAAGLAQQTLLGPLASASLRFFPLAREEGRVRAFLAAVGRLATRASVLLAAGAAAVLAGFLLGGAVRWLPLIVVAGLYSVAAGVAGVIDLIQMAARQRVLVAWHGTIAQWTRVLFAVAAIRLLGPSSVPAMIGYLAATLVVLASQAWFLRRLVHALSEKDAADDPERSRDVERWSNAMTAYGWPFATWGVFAWAQQSGDRWALQAFATTRDVGLFAVLYQLGYYPVSMVTTLVSQLTAPILFNRAGDGTDERRMADARKLNALLVGGALGVTAAGTAAAFLLHDDVFRWFAGPEYRSVSPLLPWVVLAGGLFGAGQLAILGILSDANTRRLIVPKIGSALLGLLLSVAGAASGGLQGVVAAGVVFALLFFAWSVALASTRPTGQRYAGEAVPSA